MTERTGGSDVGRAETEARCTSEGWRLYGTKWFASTVTSEMALALARPEGNPPGGRGLALFYVERRDADGGLNGIYVNRLKEKLGSRKLPTAELTLDGALAHPVAGLQNGTRNIAPMLNVTRLWNAVAAVARMRRGLALARDYAARRAAFGAALADQPLHAETLADLQAQYEVLFHLSFRAAELFGAEEAGEVDPQDAALLRLLIPISKLVATRHVVGHTSEVLEAFGGAGYIEDTGLPMMLRDAQLLPIWEGTTNVLALDALRALSNGPDPLFALRAEVETLAAATRHEHLRAAARRAQEVLAQALAWIGDHAGDRATLEAGARRFCLAVGHAHGLALLCRHAQWSLDRELDARAAAAAVRFAARPGLAPVFDAHPAARAALALDRPLVAL
jgi:hypothetical protein